MVNPRDMVARSPTSGMWLDIPDFVGEIQFSVKLLQGEYMDVGLVQGQGAANMIQLITWEQVAVCCDLDGSSEYYVGNIKFCNEESLLAYKINLQITITCATSPPPTNPPAWAGSLLGCHSSGGGGPESPRGSCDAVVGSRVPVALLSGQQVVIVPVEQEHQERRSGGANTGFV